MLRYRFLDILLVLLLAFLPVVGLCASEMVEEVRASELVEEEDMVTAADGTQYTEAQLDSLRMAEDFIQVSLVVLDPTHVLYSVLGHACLRLQCPVYGLDYCFSYESEDVSHRVLSFFAGNLRTSLLCVPFDEYVACWQEEGRGLQEYKMNLPALAEQNLWRILDEHVVSDSDLPYDYYHRGCAAACVQFVNEALGDTPIHYAEWGEDVTGRDIGKRYTENALWQRFVICFVSGTEIDEPLVGEKRLIAPNDLVKAWQHATVNGQPLLENEAHVWIESSTKMTDFPFTPVMAAILLLMVVIVGWIWDVPYGDWLVVIIQTGFGILLTYLVLVSDLCCTGWNWLMVPCNVLPILFWHWRRYWSIPYALVIIVWIIGMCAYPHVLVDGSHVVLAIAILVMLLHQTKLRQYNWKYIQKRYEKD